MRLLTGLLTGTAALGLAAGCGTTSVSTATGQVEVAKPAGPAATADPGWQALPDPPISPRHRAVTAWTGSEALFLGGDTAPPCPFNSDCVRADQAARDGAAYDPVSGSWRATAPAPVNLLYAPSTVTGDEVFVLAADRLYSYDASDDAWTTHPSAPGRAGRTGHLVAAGDRVLLVAGTHERTGKAATDLSYDPAAGPGPSFRWTRWARPSTGRRPGPTRGSC